MLRKQRNCIPFLSCFCFRYTTLLYIQSLCISVKFSYLYIIKSVPEHSQPLQIRPHHTKWFHIRRQSRVLFICSSSWNCFVATWHVHDGRLVARFATSCVEQTRLGIDEDIWSNFAHAFAVQCRVSVEYQYSRSRLSEKQIGEKVLMP